MASLDIEGVSKRYGQYQALDGLSLHVDPGEVMVLLGASGCGKTSLLMMMAGLRHQTSGTIDIQGRPIDKPDPANFDLVVNATPAGMKAGDPLPVDASKIAASTFVADIITMPVVTPLLQAAQAKGCAIQNGVQMFDAQVDFITEFLMGRSSS